MFDCLRGEWEGAVRTVEHCFVDCRKLATLHQVKTVNVAFNRLLRMLTDRWQMKFAYTSISWLMLCCSRVPLSQSECLLNKSMGVAQNVSAIAVGAASRLQIVFNCGHCADRSGADVIYVPWYSGHAAAKHISGATGSGPMQINNDQSRIEYRDWTFGSRWQCENRFRG